MLWYSRLYVGEKARKHLFPIIRSIREKKYRPGVFVITPASNGNNILDIYPGYMLLMESVREQELTILGVADGYQDALLLAGTIVEEMYKKTGGFCLEELLTERGGKVW